LLRRIILCIFFIPAVPWTYANSGVIWKVTKINNNNNNSSSNNSPAKSFILKQVPSSTSPPGSVVIKQPNTVNQVTISAFKYNNNNTAMSNSTNISKSNATSRLQ